MKSSSALRRLAAKVDNLFNSKASFAANDAQFDAEQRNEFDITKSKDAGASDGLGNVVRVPTSGGNGVSQAPASETPLKGGFDASEQPVAALQGGNASPRMSAANAASFDAAWSARKPLMDAVEKVRQALASYGHQQDSTAKKYRRIAIGLRKEIKSLARTLPRQATQSLEEYAVYVLSAVLGSHAESANTFYAYRRGMHFWAEAELRRLLKKQNRLQRRHQKRISRRAHLLPILMQRSAAKLELYLSNFQLIGHLQKQACQEICDQAGNEVKQAKLQPTKNLVRLLNRCKPDWQSIFLAANTASGSQYRSHALLQAITGLRPAEFEPVKSNPKRKALKGDASPGVVVTMLSNHRIHIRIPGSKVTLDAGHVERSFEVPADAFPAWFLDELAAAGGSKRYVAKPQALRDHYERISVQAFGKKPADPKQLWLHATPYCFRHALATNLRWSGWEVQEIAGVLGQRSADTQRHYGFRKGGPKKPKSYREPNIVKSSVLTSQTVKPQSSPWQGVSGAQKVRQRSPS